MPIEIARVVRTCCACPSQRDTWTTTGRYLYLHYRGGVGTVTEQPSSDPSTWDIDRLPVVEFGDPSLDGDISLEDFLSAAGMALAPACVVVGNG